MNTVRMNALREIPMKGLMIVVFGAAFLFAGLNLTGVPVLAVGDEAPAMIVVEPCADCDAECSECGDCGCEDCDCCKCDNCGCEDCDCCKCGDCGCEDCDCCKCNDCKCGEDCDCAGKCGD